MIFFPPENDPGSPANEGAVPSSVSAPQGT